ncbi:MAG: DUF732 domain-containing protein [Gordonia sp. (in: high G+C Gram-positive bacteria)]|uniref:DUF732 domain-containing protein n=1 Tax=Gordonia sp. (in: high G+C Gram-positive bacteria) TaxID=84139 RepID=UPI0039E33748
MRATRRRLLMIPIAAAAALVLGACGGGDGGGDAGESDPSAETAASASGDPEARFITALETARIDTGDRDALVAQGKKACEGLKSGKSMSDLLNEASKKQGQEQMKALAVTGAAVGAFCPDQQSKLVPSGVPTAPADPTE